VTRYFANFSGFPSIPGGYMQQECDIEWACFGHRKGRPSGAVCAYDGERVFLGWPGDNDFALSTPTLPLTEHSLRH